MKNKLSKSVTVFLCTVLLFSGCTSGEAKQSTPSSGSTAVSVRVAEKQSYTVYITKTGKKYHSAGCRYLSQSCIPVDLDELDTKKYTPCSVCEP